MFSFPLPLEFDFLEPPTQERQAIQYGKKFALAVTSSLSAMLKTSKGRDKICALIQYFSDFYMNCSKNSSIPEIRELYQNNMILSAKVSSKIKDSMSQSRKIFRFLNFIIEIRKIYLAFSSKKGSCIKILLILQHLLSTFFYISDSLLLFVTLSSSLLPPSLMTPIKRIKNLFSLLRLIIVFLKISLSLSKRRKRESERKEEIKRKGIKEGGVLVEKIIKGRRRRREEFVDAILCGLRAVVAIKSLRIEKLEMNRIFVSSCGLVASWISFLSLAIADSSYIKIKKKPKIECEEDPKYGMVSSFCKKKLISASSLINMYESTS